MRPSHLTKTSCRHGENRAAAFTIVELLVVIAIVAVLAAIVLVNVTSYIAKGRRSAVEGDLSTMLTNASSYSNNSSSGYTGFHTDPTYLNPKVAIENITGTNTVVENETSTAFCACAPLPDIPGSTSQTWCVDSTGNKTQTPVVCSSECQSSSASCYSTGTSGGVINGLVGYWKLDESLGSSAADASGNGNTGTYNGTTASTSVPAIHFADPYSRSFNGTSDYLDIPSGSSLHPTGAVSISLWVKSASSTWSGSDAYSSFVAQRTSGNGNQDGYLFGPEQPGTSNQISFRIGGNTTNYVLTYTPSFDITQWHHYAATYDGTTMAIYVDGTLAASATHSDTIAYAGTIYDLNIGRDDSPGDTSRFIHANIDDVRIYNRALSATEISTLAAGN